jgi:hypothetical protein
MNPLQPEPQSSTAGDLSDRDGFDDQFLGLPVRLPALNGIDTALLAYTHFSILRRLDKRLAAVTALGIDGEKLMDLDRTGIQWRLDPRLRKGTTNRGKGLRPQRYRPGTPCAPGISCLGYHPGRSRAGQRGHIPLYERSAVGSEVQPGRGPMAGSGVLSAGQRS